MNSNDIIPGAKLVFGKWKKQIKSKNAPVLPLTWTVLDVWDDSALILCDTLTAEVPFHSVEGPITWKDCSLRKWLNFDFVKEAFSMDEIDMIEKHPLPSAPEIKDQVFILSVEEIEKYLSGEEIRTPGGITGIPARATLKHGIPNKKGDEYWWTRSSLGSDPRFGAMFRHVDLNGYVYSGSTPTYCERWVRPACFISVSAFTKPAAQ